MDKFDGAADCEESLWNRVLGINLTGPYLMTKLAVNHFLERNSPGVILNICSLGGVFGHRSGAAYTASKHGLVGLTKNTAAAYANNKIRCNAICPGGMQTNIGVAMAGGVNQAGYAILQKCLASNPGLCDLDEMANLAVFLCGSGSGVLNGAVINADMGWSAV